MATITSLKLPASKSHPEGQNTVETTGVVVIVGANGAGKTRLGSWIEFRDVYVNQTHRISAQKSLSLPTSIQPISIDKAESELLYGHELGGTNPSGFKTGQRWKAHPNTFPLDDFDRLMVYLFSEEIEQNAQYKRAQKESKVRLEPTDTKLDLTKRIFERALPKRELIIGGGKLEARTKATGGASYNAAEMSDGERVIFYLTGQALAAPRDGIIIIDEPELHLHKSIQAKLWDEIEAERPDCLFVYLTHDIEFASSRIGATKVWLKEFDGTSWEWEPIGETETAGLPEEILLEILGSRKPVLFVEGERSSIDHLVFTHLYPEWNVTSCGPCGHVLNATRSFESLKHLHNLSCRGIIDRDIRSQEEITYLRDRNVYVLDFAEVENLFLIEDVLRIASKELLVPEDHAVDATKKLVLSELAREKEAVISAAVARKIEGAVRNFDAKAQGETALTNAVDTVWKSIDVKALYADVSKDVEKIISDRDYMAALKIYSNKGLVSRIGSLFKHKDFPDYLRRLLLSDRGDDLTMAMLKHTPQVRA
jgi:hypothetical protein